MATQPGSAGGNREPAAPKIDETEAAQTKQPRVVSGKWPANKYTQADLNSAGEEASALMREPRNERMRAAFEALVCVRQLHALAAVALSEEVQRLAAGGDSSCAVEHVLRASADHQGRKAFERDDVLDRTSRWLLPFVAAEAQLERSQREAVMAAASAEKRSQQYQRLLPIAVPATVEALTAFSSQVARGSVVVIVGDTAATTSATIYHCVEQWLNYTNPLRVAFLRARDAFRGNDYVANKAYGSQLALVPAATWTGITTGSGLVRAAFTDPARRLRDKVCDIVVIEDYAKSTRSDAVSTLPRHEQLLALRRAAATSPALVVLGVTLSNVEPFAAEHLAAYASRFVSGDTLHVVGVSAQQLETGEYELSAHHAPTFTAAPFATLAAAAYADPQLPEPRNIAS